MTITIIPVTNKIVSLHHRIVFVYNRLLPLDSIRRFVIDQIIIWICWCGYYTILAVPVTIISLLIFYIVGYCTAYIGLGPTIFMDTPLAMMAWGFAVFGGSALVVIITTCSGYWIHRLDYTPWISAQETYLDMINRGVHDEEIADDVPINLTNWHQFWNTVLPIGSTMRYLALRFLFIAVIILCIVAYVVLSILLFRLFITEPTSFCPKVLKGSKDGQPGYCGLGDQFGLSIAGQIILAIIIGVLLAIFINPCDKAWRLHSSKAQKRSQ